MERYTLYCTSEQTKKALELGAPIEKSNSFNDYLPHEMIDYVSEHGNVVCAEFIFPTAEQMRGWLRDIFGLRFYCGEDEKGIIFINIYTSKRLVTKGEGFSPEEATLAAIDAALDYLIKNKKG